MQHLRLGIDCRLGGTRHAGIGRYISEYVHQLAHQPDLHVWCLCTDQAQADELLSSFTEKQLKKFSVTIAPIQHYSLAEQIKLPALFNNWPIDVLHIPHFNEPIGYQRPIVVTIHDLLWHSTRGAAVTTLNPLIYWPKYVAYRWLVGHTVRRAATIFVPTNTVAEQVKQHYPEAENKLVATYEGVSELFQPNDHVHRSPQTLLYVGSLYPHKNLAVVLAALLQLPNYQLRIVSSRNAFSDSMIERICQLELSQRVLFIGNVDDSQLLQEYQQASALIQPSKSEGFGLTGVEALATNTPVIASDIAVFHEVYEDAAEYFNPESSASLIALLQSFDTHRQINNARWQGARRSVLSRCSWSAMTESMLQSMRSSL